MFPPRNYLLRLIDFIRLLIGKIIMIHEKKLQSFVCLVKFSMLSLWSNIMKQNVKKIGIRCYSFLLRMWLKFYILSTFYVHLVAGKSCKMSYTSLYFLSLYGDVELINAVYWNWMIFNRVEKILSDCHEQYRYGWNCRLVSPTFLTFIWQVAILEH